MPYVKDLNDNPVKVACEPCIRGHRSSKCAHFDRILQTVRKPGRPLSSCPHRPGTCNNECGGDEPLLYLIPAKLSGCGCPVSVLSYVPLRASDVKSRHEHEQEQAAAGNSHDRGLPDGSGVFPNYVDWSTAQVSFTSPAQDVTTADSQSFGNFSVPPYAQPSDNGVSTEGHLHTHQHQPRQQIGMMGVGLFGSSQDQLGWSDLSNVHFESAEPSPKRCCTHSKNVQSNVQEGHELHQSLTDQPGDFNASEFSIVDHTSSHFDDAFAAHQAHLERCHHHDAVALTIDQAGVVIPHQQPSLFLEPQQPDHLHVHNVHQQVPHNHNGLQNCQHDHALHQHLLCDHSQHQSSSIDPTSQLDSHHDQAAHEHSSNNETSPQDSDHDHGSHQQSTNPQQPQTYVYVKSPNTTKLKVRADCDCGPRCLCFGCPLHPTNSVTLKAVKDLWEAQLDIANSLPVEGEADPETGIALAAPNRSCCGTNAPQAHQEAPIQDQIQSEEVLEPKDQVESNNQNQSEKKAQTERQLQPAEEAQLAGSSKANGKGLLKIETQREEQTQLEIQARPNAGARRLQSRGKQRQHRLQPAQQRQLAQANGSNHGTAQSHAQSNALSQAEFGPQMNRQGQPMEQQLAGGPAQHIQQSPSIAQDLNAQSLHRRSLSYGHAQDFHITPENGLVPQSGLSISNPWLQPHIGSSNACLQPSFDSSAPFMVQQDSTREVCSKKVGACECGKSCTCVGCLEHSRGGNDAYDNQTPPLRLGDSDFPVSFIDPSAGFISAYLSSSSQVPSSSSKFSDSADPFSDPDTPFLTFPEPDCEFTYAVPPGVENDSFIPQYDACDQGLDCVNPSHLHNTFSSDDAPPFSL